MMFSMFLSYLKKGVKSVMTNFQDATVIHGGEDRN